MSQFRKKPVVIEAERFDDDFRTKYYGTAHRTGISFHHDYALIQTLEGTMRAELGDWIITGVKGERYQCKPDIFSATYEAVEPSVTSLPPSAPQATGGTKEWARSPFDTGECCCNVHGEDGRLACPIHGLPARLPAAREAPADGAGSTVSEGETRAKTSPSSSAVPTPPEAERIDLLLAMARDWLDPVVVRDAPERVPVVIEQLIAKVASLAADLARTQKAVEEERFVRQVAEQAEMQYHKELVSAVADLATVTRERDALKVEDEAATEAYRIQGQELLHHIHRAEVAEQALRELEKQRRDAAD